MTLPTNLASGAGTTSKTGSGIGTGVTAGGGIGAYELFVYLGFEAIPAAFAAMVLGALIGVVAQWARDRLTWGEAHAENGGPPSLGTLGLRLLAALGVLVLALNLTGCATAYQSNDRQVGVALGGGSIGDCDSRSRTEIASLDDPNAPATLETNAVKSAEGWCITGSRVSRGFGSVFGDLIDGILSFVGLTRIGSG